jgi:CDGSH-type Zn-finger protein
MKDENYGNSEEKRVIQGSETKTARANGEISKTKPYSRESHGRSGKKGNKHVKVKNETSTEIIKRY